MAKTDTSAPGRPTPLTVIQSQYSDLRCRGARVPIGFWGDQEDPKCRAAQFEHFPGACREFTGNGATIGYRRSAPANFPAFTMPVLQFWRQRDEESAMLLESRKD